jgi:hypothetical protein
MIAVRVREDDVLDSVWVEPELPQTADDLVLCGVVEQRLDDDDAFAADDGPCAVDLGADEVEVVGNLGRFRIPRVSRRRRRRCSPSAPTCAGSRRRRRRRRNAQPKIRARPFQTGCILRRRKETIDSGGRRLRRDRCGGGDEQDRRVDEEREHFHRAPPDALSFPVFTCASVYSRPPK